MTPHALTPEAAALPSQLPALQVVVPMLAAPVLILLRRPGLCWAASLAVTLVVFAISLALMAKVLAPGAEPLSYALGGWPPPWGIELRVDPLSALVLTLVSGIAALVMMAGRASLEDEIPAQRLPLFYALFLLCLTGLLGMTSTGDAFNLFVFLEVSSLSTYAMVAQGRDRRALVAAYNYLVLGTVGATFYVIGIGMLYMMTGSLNMADLAQRLPEVSDSRTLLVATAFLAIGLSLKLALFPLHKWLPPAYTHAPSMVTTFLASTATKVSLYVMIRLFLSVLAPALTARDTLFLITDMGLAMVFALAAMFSGSLVAIFQTNIKRMLAYSSVAQIGYMVLGASMLSVTGLSAGLVHMVNHAVIKATLFLALAAVILRTGSAQIDSLAGMGRRMPWTMAAFVLGGLSLIGVPGTAGFVSKWQLVLGAFEADNWWIAFLIGASSLLAVVYIWRVVEVAYFRAPAPASTEAANAAGGDGAAPPATGRHEAPLSMLIPLWGIALLNIGFGLWTDGTLAVARLAAQSLLGDPAPMDLVPPDGLPAIGESRP